MAKTKIEWADVVWNPVTGCNKVSEGCKNCYAERISNRFWGERKFTDIVWNPGRLDDPLSLKKPRRVFVNSMGDLFHERVPDKFLDQVFARMAIARSHTFIVLTKRPKRMLDYFNRWTNGGWATDINRIWPLPNVWIGVSAEDQQTADERIPLLLKTPAAVRFVSVEPMLEAVDLEYPGYLEGANEVDDIGCHYASPALDWVICGGEGGPGARPMHPDWARSLRDQCNEANMPFFFKGWGNWWPKCPQYSDTDSVERFDGEHPNAEYEARHEICLENDGSISQEWDVDIPIIQGWQPIPGLNPWWMLDIGKKQSGRLLDGREWNEFPGDRHDRNDAA